MKAILLSLLLTQAPDAGSLNLVPVYPGDLVQAPGVWVDGPTFIKMAQRTASAEAERDALRANPPMPALSPWAAVLLALGIGVGIGVGWSLHAQLGAK